VARMVCATCAAILRSRVAKAVRARKGLSVTRMMRAACVAMMTIPAAKAVRARKGSSVAPTACATRADTLITPAAKGTRAGKRLSVAQMACATPAAGPTIPAARAIRAMKGTSAAWMVRATRVVGRIILAAKEVSATRDTPVARTTSVIPADMLTIPAVKAVYAWKAVNADQMESAMRAAATNPARETGAARVTITTTLMKSAILMAIWAIVVGMATCAMDGLLAWTENA
jgi:hypothetical protein